MGEVRSDEGVTVIVRFDDGLEECEKSQLEPAATALQAVSAPQWHPPLEVITRAQAAAIESVNDMWGVLSTSRIALLPHQLWVCRRVLQTWPTRWLVADDVGLGKTIEAGIVLWPLLAKGTVRRLLILCPASLVGQWQERLREMFDIRVSLYTDAADTERSDFWGTHHQVVASLQTLRADTKDRHHRLLESDPWDLVVVDEAHHLNADEKSGPTLSYQLLEKLVDYRRVRSMLFFTGTPHRGKNFAFLALLKLLRADLFDPKAPFGPQLKHLREVMIRNNKQNVTDLKGRLLFQPPAVKNIEFEYSEEEGAFYAMLTDFIQSGQAYASSLDATAGKAVQLVLVAMQKLASSSVAAIRRALKRRLERIAEDRDRLQDLEGRRELRGRRIPQYGDYEHAEDLGDLDVVSRLDEEIAELSGQLQLMDNEEPRLRELVAAAERVRHETKIDRILQMVRDEFNDRRVLFFTEYKATQSLLMSSLMREHGAQCVTFINGDDRADEVILPSGVPTSLMATRFEAADRFNSGNVRFLVSTEAGGEGIDLQESCHTIVHVDLPWNPMRLHQRVGRLNRYGQKERVEVVVLRNPHTVEGRIWQILQEKMDRIMVALGHAMEEPEDLLQLVLGMTSPGLWRELFAEAPRAPGEVLTEWFDRRTARFGSKDVLQAVQQLVGNCARFDFQEVSDQLPRIDLPALRPFFLSMLRLNRRRFEEREDGLAFLTPPGWLEDPGMRKSYDKLVFDRQVRGRDAARRVLGVGHKLVNQALRQARESVATVAALPVEALRKPLLVYRIRDRVTGEQANVRSVSVGVEIAEPDADGPVLLKDWELLDRLNSLGAARGVRARDSAPAADPATVQRAVDAASALIRASVTELGLPFVVPEIEPLVLLWPASDRGAGDDEDEEGPDDTGEGDATEKKIAAPENRREQTVGGGERGSAEQPQYGGNRAAGGPGEGGQVRVSFHWRPGDVARHGRPSADFALAVASLVGGSGGEILMVRPDGTADEVDLGECATALARDCVGELRLALAVGDDESRTKITVSIPSPEKSEILLPVSALAEACPTEAFPPGTAPLWLQCDVAGRSPLSILTLTVNHRNLHVASLHGLAVLACKVGEIDRVKAFALDGRKIGSWQSLATPTARTLAEVAPGLWRPAVATTEAAVDLTFEPGEAVSPYELADLSGWKARVAAALEDDAADLAPLQRCLRELGPELSAIQVGPLQPSSPSDQRALAVLTAQGGALRLDLDLERPRAELVQATLHAIGHVRLGHVRAGDDYVHRDDSDAVRSVQPARRWDREVLAAFPVWFETARRIESIADCTPTEKAQLGLWRMIGEMLGERRQLHPQAVAYQKAVYQRQAAERLVAMLEDFGGAMLCDGVGLGKTYVATTVITHYANAWRAARPGHPERPLTDPFRITVLAPYSVVSTWRREALPALGQFGVPLSAVRVVSHTALSRIGSTSDILEHTAWGKPSDFEHLLLSDLVIVDEAHNFRSSSARRTLVLRDLLRVQPRRDPRRRVLLLTATPVNNSLDDLIQEVALLFSRPLWLSEARTEDGYRRQVEKEVNERCARARRSKSRADHAALLVHGDANARFSFANEFRDDLDFGPKVQRIGDYLKEQDRRLKSLQQQVRDAARLGVTTETRHAPVRIAEELLDRIVVQRSRRLCKEIEREHNSNVELLFRPDPGPPERLRYSDEFDGIRDVLARFLPLFDRGVGRHTGGTLLRPLSFKVFMWYDVREGLKSPDDTSSVVGLQRILALKRLESSPVSFLITLLRLTVLHAHRLRQLADLGGRVGEGDRVAELRRKVDSLLRAQPESALEKIRWLATNGEFHDVRRDFMRQLSDAYVASRPAAATEDPSPQMLLIPDEQSEEGAASRQELDRLLGLQDSLFDDFATLLGVAPDLADIVFGRFQRREWPRSFVAGGESVNWPRSAAWGLRMVGDAKLRRLFERIVEARRRGQRVIVFSQFSDTIAYVQSVLRACESLSRQDWPMLLHGLDVPKLRREEIKDLLCTTAAVTGSSEHREELVNSFAPFYRIGPHRPQTDDTSEAERSTLFDEWEAAWSQAIERPVHVLFSSDVLAEGVNLQDTALLVNVDVHWNPVRMIQRAGRVDRRLNPLIEKSETLPELEALGTRCGKPVPKYYWREHPNEGPVIVNMILPDELEAELLLRERIAVKSLAIDFTLGLEQGTGAEADWMAAYIYRGVSSLNAFQRDRAIEEIAGHHEKLQRRFHERGIAVEWAERLDSWLRAGGASEASPLIARAMVGRRGTSPERFQRYLEPLVLDGVVHWCWAERVPGESMYDCWLALTGEKRPPATRRDLPWQPSAAGPLTAVHLLTALLALENAAHVAEVPRERFLWKLVQGATALAAPKLGSEEDRKTVVLGDYFVLQMPDFDVGYAAHES